MLRCRRTASHSKASVLYRAYRDIRALGSSPTSFDQLNHDTMPRSASVLIIRSLLHCSHVFNRSVRATCVLITAALVALYLEGRKRLFLFLFPCFSQV